MSCDQPRLEHRAASEFQATSGSPHGGNSEMASTEIWLLNFILQQPSVWNEAVEEMIQIDARFAAFESKMALAPAPETGTLTMTISSDDPHCALVLSNCLSRAADEYLYRLQAAIYDGAYRIEAGEVVTVDPPPALSAIVAEISSGGGGPAGTSRLTRLLKQRFGPDLVSSIWYPTPRAKLLPTASRSQ